MSFVIIIYAIHSVCITYLKYILWGRGLATYITELDPEAVLEVWVPTILSSLKIYRITKQLQSGLHSFVSFLLRYDGANCGRMS